MRKKRKFSLAKLIVIVFIIFMIIYVFFPKNNNQEVEDNTNPYLENHVVEHVENTSSSSVNTIVSKEAREKYTKILGDQKDEVNVMVYIIGTDLESGYGAATMDLNEMLHAEIQDNINIIIQTGGCKKWQNNVISNRSIERYTINSEGLLRLETNIENAPMTDEETLTSFIKYAHENYPTANRNILILWDHGGGSAAGYGYDENYPNAGSMAPDAIGRALKEANVKFDIIGFDACLMANLETAIAIEPYADYLLASEETEPGEGWYYTNWIKAIDDNTSMSSVELGKLIIDDYIEHSTENDSNSSNNYMSSVLFDNLVQDRKTEATLSIIDLGELVSNISKPLVTFSKATTEKLNSDAYQEIGKARSNTKEFSKDSYLDQVDLVDLVMKFDVEGSKELANGIKNSIKYNKTANISDSYGLSAYFPYSALSKVNDMVEIYDNINMDTEYSSVIKSFASIAASGQIVTNNSGSSSTSIFDILLGNDYYNEPNYSNDYIYDIFNEAYGHNNNYYGYDDVFGYGYDDWFDYDYLDPMSNFFGRSQNNFDTSKLKLTKKDKQKVVELTDEQWSLIDTITLNMFIDDGEGYIDLGKDNAFEFNKYGDLIAESDGTWLSINDHVVSYILVSDTVYDSTRYKTVGKISAYLNNERVDLIINFTDIDPYGIVLGAKKVSTNGTEIKGLIKIQDGDEIKFIANYYSYDGKFIDEYQIGDTLIVDGELELNNIYLDNNYIYTYCFKDYYGNNMYTPKQEVNK